MAEEIRKIVTIDTEGSEQTVAGLRKEMSELRDVILNTTKGTEQYDAATKQLQADQQTLNSVMSVSKTGLAGLKDELKQAKDVMATAAKGTDEYAAAAIRAAEASAKLRDMQEEVRYGDTGLDGQFEITTKTLGNLAGGFQAVQGAMALFGVENEDLKKRFVKLQAAMSLTGGLKSLASLPKSLNAAKIAFGNLNKGVKAFTVSLKGVKGAIAATGLGLLLVLLGELYAHWEDITKAVGNFTGAMDKVKEVLAGVGTVIKNYVLGPIKAMAKVLQGDFKGAVDEIKNQFNVVASYTEGASKQAAKNAEKRTQKTAEETQKQLDYEIKMNEAQYGSDWKYTKEAYDTYHKFFEAKLAMYKKDSDEYKEVLIEMAKFDREFTEGPKKSGGGGKSPAEKAREEYEKAATEAEKILLTEYGKMERELEENLKKLEPLVKKAFSNQPFLDYEKNYKKAANEIIATHHSTLTTLFKDNELTFKGFQKALKDGNEEQLQIYQDLILRNEDLFKGDAQRLYDAIDVLGEKGKFLFANYAKQVRVQMTNGNKEMAKEAADILNEYNAVAEKSIKKGFLNEADWKLFFNSVDKYTEEFLMKQDVYWQKLAIDIQRPIGLVDYLLNKGNLTEIAKILPIKLNADYKYTEEGANAYRQYYQTLADYYEGDFQKWMEIQLQRRDFEEDQLKHKDEVERKRLQRELKTNMERVQGYQAQLDLGKDFDFWAFAYGIPKEKFEKGWKEYKETVEELQEVTGKADFFIIPDETGMITGWERIFGWIKEESLETYDKFITDNNAYLANFIQGINIQIAELEKEMDLETLTAEEKIALQDKIAEFEQQKAAETYKVYAENKDKELEKAKKIEAMKKALVKNTADLFGNVSDLLSEYADKNAETNRAAAEKQFNASKALGIAETITSTLATVQNIIKSYSGMGPWGTAAGAVAGAAALAAGWARVMQIKNQKFDADGGGSSSSSISMGTAVPIPNIGQDLPYDYTRNITTGQDEDEYNQRPIVVSVVDIEDALKTSENRKAETTF